VPVRRVDPSKERGRLYRAYARIFGATAPALWLSRHVAWKLDPFLMRISGGRIRLTPVIPTVVLETRGARTGAVRRNAVIYFHDGDDVVVVPAKAGAPEHPAWFHNARANPDVRVNGEPYRATVLTQGAEAQRLWALADRVFPPFATFRERAAATGRTIPLVRLVPDRDYESRS
jgi:deazaflavin-dependent oxidoreductase (nitroreductase family)